MPRIYCFKIKIHNIILRNGGRSVQIAKILQKNFDFFLHTLTVLTNCKNIANLFLKFLQKFFAILTGHDFREKYDAF